MESLNITEKTLLDMVKYLQQQLEESLLKNEKLENEVENLKKKININK